MILLKTLQKLEFPKKLGLCELLFSKSLESRGIVIIKTAHGLQWKLDMRNSTHRWIVYGLYDPPFLTWAKKFLPKNGLVVDSGANIGQTAQYLGRLVPEGRLFAFEPGRKQADWLRECIELNKLELPTTQVQPFALGEKKEQLYLEDTWKSERFHGGSSEISKERGEPIEVVRLDEFLSQKGIKSLDLWKLDVEGYELPALKGAESLLKAQKIRALYVELYRQDGEEFKQHGIKIRELLSNYGYVCHVFEPNTRRLRREMKWTHSADGLFLPRTHA